MFFRLIFVYDFFEKETVLTVLYEIEKSNISIKLITPWRANGLSADLMSTWNFLIAKKE